MAEHAGMTGPCRILLINPNSSAATTAMMVAIAAACCEGRADVFGATAAHAPAMIVDAEALAASATEVVELGHAHRDNCHGIIVAAFGDPGAAELRATSVVPVIGIGEAAMREAAQGGRRFGIATVTPALWPASRVSQPRSDWRARSLARG
jgi:allantoin racemase